MAFGDFSVLSQVTPLRSMNVGKENKFGCLSSSSIKHALHMHLKIAVSTRDPSVQASTENDAQAYSTTWMKG